LAFKLFLNLDKINSAVLHIFKDQIVIHGQVTNIFFNNSEDANEKNVKLKTIHKGFYSLGLFVSMLELFNRNQRTRQVSFLPPLPGCRKELDVKI